MEKRFTWAAAGITLSASLGMVALIAINATLSRPSSAFPVDGALPVLPKPNAYDGLLDIADRLRVPQSLTNRNVKDWKDNPRAEEVLATNAGQFTRIDDVLNQVYGEPSSEAVVPLFPHHSKFKNLGRLLILRGDLAFRKGAFQVAAADYLRVARMGWRIANGSYDVGFLSGDQLTYMGLRALNRAAKRLPARERNVIGKQLERMAVDSVSMSRPIEWEKFQAQFAWNRVLAKPSWAKDLKAELGVEQLFTHDLFKQDRIEELKGKLGFEADKSSTLERFLIERTRPESLYRNSTAYYDAWIERVRGKFSSRSAAMPTLVAPGNTPDIFTGWIQAVELRYNFKDSIWLSRLRTMTILKLSAISLLGDVAFANRTLVKDPFDPGKGFRRFRTSKRTLVYSVGPDGKDDQGAPLRDLTSFSEIEDLEMFRGDLATL